MSEPIPAEISIGGEIPNELVPGLCKAIADERVSLEWGDAYFRPGSALALSEVCQYRHGVRLLCLCDDQANYGEFGILEKFLSEAGICYRRHSDAKYEFDSEVVEFRPGIGRVEYLSNNDGESLVPLATLTRIAGAVDNATNTAEGQQSALELLRRLRNLQQLVHESMPIQVPPLAPFHIVS